MDQERRILNNLKNIFRILANPSIFQVYHISSLFMLYLNKLDYSLKYIKKKDFFIQKINNFDDQLTPRFSERKVFYCRENHHGL